jgi:hypothetical protein
VFREHLSSQTCSHEVIPRHAPDEDSTPEPGEKDDKTLAEDSAIPDITPDNAILGDTTKLANEPLNDTDQGELEQQNEPQDQAQHQRRSGRAGQGQSSHYDSSQWVLGLHYVMLAMVMTEPYEPRTLEEARRSIYWTKWKDACDDEIKSLRLNKTWRLKKRSEVGGNQVLRGKWVFKLKRGPDGNIQKYKARWVVRGFEQVEGSNFNETFASVVKPMSYKALFAIAAAMDYEIEQMDVKTAFLYGDIDEEVYVEQPTGYDNGKDDVCILDKGLYGLKQSPRIWYSTLTQFLRSIGFEPLTADFSVFVNG